jgi:hypothetical protein
MQKIAIISFDDDVDVSKAVEELAERYPHAEFLLPILEYGRFAKSALKAVIDTGTYHLFFSETASIDDYAVEADDITFCINPIKEILRQLDTGDVLGIVWDESLESHSVLHSLEDFALDMWDITDGLDPIEIDYSEESETEELFDAMTSTLNLFAESLAAYVTSAVLDVLTDTIRERLEEEGTMKDISPFDDDL